jgi:hypothetical protein
VFHKALKNYVQEEGPGGSLCYLGFSLRHTEIISDTLRTSNTHSGPERVIGLPVSAKYTAFFVIFLCYLATLWILS